MSMMLSDDFTTKRTNATNGVLGGVLEGITLAQIKGINAGGVIKPDNEDNLQVYGMNAHDILTGADKISMENMPEGVRVFPQTLARHSRRR